MSAATTAREAAKPPTTHAVRRLTGIKPTGRLQLGNYLGAIRPMLAAQGLGPEAVVAVVDLHALTVAHRPHEVRATTWEQVATLLAAGADPQHTTLYVQSHLPQHTELHYLLECTTGYGEAHRMIQFREKSATQRHVRLSLLTYPVLMAADILLHDIDEVPVGEDQRQHLELARQIATRFNNRYGETFTVPKGVTPERAARIMDLADPSIKMEKSATDSGGVLRLLDPPDVVRRKVNRAVTDNDGEVRYDPAGKPGVSNLLEILGACTDRPPETAAHGLVSYRGLKAAVVDTVVDTLAPLQRRYTEVAADPAEIHRLLAAGVDRARDRAAPTVARARRAIGLLVP